MYKLLSKINNTEDLKKLEVDELNQLSKELRHFLIDSVSQTGGHLASNLGVVELTVALHYCFDSPEDKFIFDVGHQSYIHKILTGRKEELKTIRKIDGISGFPKRSESKHDIFDTGHSSTSISAAMGLAKKRDLYGEDYHIISIIGDGSLTGGIAFEALNNAANLDSNFIVILNDNQMSISENVGGLSVYLDSIRTANIYTGVKEDVQYMLSKIPKVGDNIVNVVRDVKDGIKQLIIPGMFFEEMGFTYLGPIDGNNIKQLLSTLNQAKRMNKPTIIHINTLKGKGYPLAEKYPSAFHGVKPFNKQTGKPLSVNKQATYSSVFGNTLCELAKGDLDVVAITAAMPHGTGLSTFKKLYPKRCIDVGIAEQHAVTFAGGLAVAGLKPFVAIYSSFLQRAYDQLVHDIALQKLPVVFCIDRSGLVGEDGETHQGVFDTSFLNHIPNMTVMAPKDGVELVQMMNFAYQYNDGPIAIKYPKGSCECIVNKNRIVENSNRDDSEEVMDSITYGKFERIQDGKGVAVLAVGSMVKPSYEVVEMLKKDGYEPTLINMRFIKPFDKERVNQLAVNHQYIIVIEENSMIGGLGTEILRVTNGQNTKVLLCGIEDQFVRHGKREELLEKCGLSAEILYTKIKRFIERI